MFGQLAPVATKLNREQTEFVFRNYRLQQLQTTTTTDYSNYSDYSNEKRSTNKDAALWAQQSATDTCVTDATIENQKEQKLNMISV